MQSRVDKNESTNNPAFTIRRHILHAKEENIQLQQMKKVNKINFENSFKNFLEIFRSLKNV